MNKIHIVNWLLTRKCNLHCDYCRIVKNYQGQPEIYPPMKHYIENEMSAETIIEGLRRIKLHNPDAFHIWYGGEPLLRPDLDLIINYCNRHNIHYTIISNNTEKVQPLMKELFSKVDYIEGFTASIDPIIYQNKNNDIFKKSFLGFQKLKEYSSVIKDRVAEITVTNENLEYLELLVRDLTNEGINSDITFVDIAKNNYYDFSDVTDDSILVKKSPELRNIINDLIDGDYNIHMKKTLLPKIYDTLPSELDCGIENDFHNMTVDSDGSIRMCLRARGVATPNNYNLSNIIDENGKIEENITKIIVYDKKNYCKFCNWSCTLMSKMISEEQENLKNLIHTEIRSKI